MAERVLIIDDDESLLKIMEHHLTKEGMDVTIALTGEEGLSKFKDGEFSAVITDIKLPEMDGMELLSRIKALSPETPVIVITAYATVEMAVDAMKKGAFDYITKPFNRDEFVLLMKRAIRLRALERENIRLRSELIEKFSFEDIIAVSDKMRKVISLVKEVAASDATVLITGETGTGKELVARAIHYNSPRRSGPFVTVNCAAIPENLLESELFGHLRGSFTGATRDKKGKFEVADGGTIFLDEIGELPLSLQAKILRVIQEKEIEPVGGTKAKRIDVRIISATNTDLEKAVVERRFREDLYWRLNVIPISIPPLRERIEDLPALLFHFLKKFMKGRDISVSNDVIECLKRYEWPGNVRELENLCERIAIFKRDTHITLSDIPDDFKRRVYGSRTRVLNIPEEGCSLQEIEGEAILNALIKNNWNKTKAAQFLKIPRHILLYKIKKHRIEK